jgi:hypothetical protein
MIHRLAADVEPAHPFDLGAPQRMPDGVQGFRGVDRRGVEVVLVVPHRDPDVAVRLDRVRDRPAFRDPVTIGHRVRTDDHFLQEARLRQPQRRFVVDVLRDFLELVDVEHRDRQAADRGVPVVFLRGFQVDAVDARAVRQVVAGFLRVPLAVRNAHQGADVAPVGNQFLIQVAFGPPGNRDLDAGEVFGNGPERDEDRPRLRRAQRAFDVDEAMLRAPDGAHDFSLHRAELHFDDPRGRCAHDGNQQ